MFINCKMVLQNHTYTCMYDVKVFNTGYTNQGNKSTKNEQKQIFCPTAIINIHYSEKSRQIQVQVEQSLNPQSRMQEDILSDFLLGDLSTKLHLINPIRTGFGIFLTLLMLRLFLSKTYRATKIFENHPITVNLLVCIRQLTEYSQVNTHLPGFRPFFSFFANVVLAKITLMQLVDNLANAK